MGTTKKPPDVLDGMIEHIRYEVMHVVDFMRFGNDWCPVLHPELCKLTQESLLEAGLIHLRCLVEFLGDMPKGDRVVARDYLPDWDWKISDQLGPVGDLHGRLAHLGIVRCSVATKGGFSWHGWLNGQAPVVLDGFRVFLGHLQNDAPARYQFVPSAPTELPFIDLVAVLDAMLPRGSVALAEGAVGAENSSERVDLVLRARLIGVI
jgi:hypothetical protein